MLGSMQQNVQDIHTIVTTTAGARERWPLSNDNAKRQTLQFNTISKANQKRKNLSIFTDAKTNKVVFEEKRAVAVDCLIRG